MLNYTLRRILGMIPTLLVISVLCFLVIKLQPGSFIDQYLEDPRFSKETVANITRQLGLDQPAWKQYLNWITGTGPVPCRGGTRSRPASQRTTRAPPTQGSSRRTRPQR